MAWRWYVPRALGEETATSVRPPPRPPGSRARGALVVVAAALLTGLGACGDDAPRQDADEPDEDFPVELVSAKFPAEQRLAETTELTLEVENPGPEDVPNLVVTVRTGDGQGAGPFMVRSEQPGLSSPSRPAWVLENGFPKLVPPGADELDSLPRGGASAARTDTFAFGPLAAGESAELVWQVTPVEAGEYAVSYRIDAGLNGRARAVDASGEPVEGEFEVTITDEVPRVEVDGAGNVVIEGD